MIFSGQVLNERAPTFVLSVHPSGDRTPLSLRDHDGLGRLDHLVGYESVLRLIRGLSA